MFACAWRGFRESLENVRMRRVGRGAFTCEVWLLSEFHFLFFFVLFTHSTHGSLVRVGAAPLTCRRSGTLELLLCRSIDGMMRAADMR